MSKQENLPSLHRVPSRFALFWLSSAGLLLLCSVVSCRDCRQGWQGITKAQKLEHGHRVGLSPWLFGHCHPVLGILEWAGAACLLAIPGSTALGQRAYYGRSPSYLLEIKIHLQITCLLRDQG